MINKKARSKRKREKEEALENRRGKASSAR